MDKNKKENHELHIQLLDNGIVVAVPEYDSLECKEFNDNGKADEAVYNMLGKQLWREIEGYANSTPTNHIKVTISIEEDV